MDHEAPLSDWVGVVVEVVSDIPVSGPSSVDDEGVGVSDAVPEGSESLKD
jgi:hypothetical protein